MPNRPAVVLFRTVAVAEAVSWVALLVAMFLKYVVEAPHEGGVPVVGMVHGVLFTAYVLVALLTARVLRWRLWPTVLLALVAAVPPLGTVVFERVATRRGLLPAGAGLRAA
ncbi:DUF3817 domain-containing protein [Kineococcus glutinatus]|uniref:DUF3817 domain-containing protein n=1 Tax=Kineococcus glutinatus TaxID=1070872 RepID=A0ABP9HWV6_9ACTN